MSDEDPPGNEPQPTNTESDGYEVGYGKPPKDNQFKPGNKLGGKKKGSRNLKAIVAEALATKATAKINGQPRKVTKIELAIVQLTNKAAAGDIKAIEKLIALSERYGPVEENEDQISDEEHSYGLETVLQYFKMRGEIEWE